MTKTSNKQALSKTTQEYASRSSIHGIGYIFDKGLSIADADRLLWIFVVLAFLGVAAALTSNFWSQWRNEQVTKDIFVGQFCYFSACAQNFNIL